MTGRVLAALTALAVGTVFLCVGGLSVLTAPAAACPALGTSGSAIASYTAEQLRNAQIIIGVGEQAGVPARGRVIAVAAALQESRLRNLPHRGSENDRDSVGLFQQRPSQGWGTPDQLTDPNYAAAAFYRHLLRIPGWERLPLTVAAQRVQGSAYPDAYAKWEPTATALVLRFTAGTAEGLCAATRWTVPVKGPVGSGFRPPDRPGHAGVDIIVPRYTVIHAASAGTVITSKCNASTGNCDVDGSPAVKGCGWYVEIAHTTGLTTRYCHMVTRPLVTAGQTVVAGQPLGRVGSSGNSSGPHLHFETRVNGDAVDPIAFMAARGAALGRNER
ncbi:M23 family metallopeptidase [Cryptosporangium minutisporangium]|uniref:M23ase beta-sheet core domain-containing protein n=1 Tax=Cryptosporangium minutisporangium TaxID=113569 RepID=A0ABP6SW15_9ACTN